MRNLDPIDRRILEILQRDGRTTMTDLAAQIGLSPTPCTERVRRLEREEIISGYHAHVNPHALGLDILLFVELRLAQKSKEILASVENELGRLDQILECHMVSGDFDYLIKARLSHTTEYRDFICNIQANIPTQTECRSYLVMDELKETRHIRTFPSP